jgi:hypothetical protein
MEGAHINLKCSVTAKDGQVGQRKLQSQILFFFFFVVLGLELRAYTLSCFTSPIFVMGFFEIRVSKTICLGCLRTVILLISVS